MTKSSWSLRQMVGGLLGNRRDDASDSFSDEPASTDVQRRTAAERDTTYVSEMNSDDSSKSIVAPRSDARGLQPDAVDSAVNAAHYRTASASEPPIAADYYLADEQLDPHAARTSFNQDRALADDDQTIEVTALETATHDDDNDEAARSDDDALDADESTDGIARSSLTSAPVAFAPESEGFSFDNGSTEMLPPMSAQRDPFGDQHIETPTVESSVYEATDDAFAFDRAGSIKQPIEFAAIESRANGDMNSRSAFTNDQPTSTTTTEVEAASPAPVVDKTDVMTSDDLLTSAPSYATTATSTDDNLLLDLEDFSSAPPAPASEPDDGLLDLDDEGATAPQSNVSSAADFGSSVGSGVSNTAAAAPLAERQAVTTPLIVPPAVTRSPVSDQSATTQVSAEHLSPEVIDQIARRVVELMSDRLVREVAWEVVPELAERMIRQRLETDESGL